MHLRISAFCIPFHLSPTYAALRRASLSPLTFIMDKSTNSLNWFEIPALDINRAKKFYETIFATALDDMPEMMGMKMSGFPAEMGNGKVTGALAQSDMHKPST